MTDMDAKERAVAQDLISDWLATLPPPLHRSLIECRGTVSLLKVLQSYGDELERAGLERAAVLCSRYAKVAKSIGPDGIPKYLAAQIRALKTACVEKDNLPDSPKATP